MEAGLSWYEQTQGAVNIALGPVLRLWHDARQHALAFPQTAYIPENTALTEALTLCNPAEVVVDRTAGTIFLSREGMSLDLGSIAKGYAVQWVSDSLAGGPVQNYLISAGGNVLTYGLPAEPKRNRWGVGLQDPDNSHALGDTAALDTLFVGDNMSVVTSGDYQRYFEVGGTRYAHLIDPRTGEPARHYRAVTVIAPDSGMADACSTALFILPLDEGKKKAAALGVEAVWILPGGQTEATDGAALLMKSKGALPLSPT